MQFPGITLRPIDGQDVSEISGNGPPHPAKKITDIELIPKVN